MKQTLWTCTKISTLGSSRNFGEEKQIIADPPAATRRWKRKMNEIARPRKTEKMAGSLDTHAHVQRRSVNEWSASEWMKIYGNRKKVSGVSDLVVRPDRCAGSRKFLPDRLETWRREKKNKMTRQGPRLEHLLPRLPSLQLFNVLLSLFTISNEYHLVTEMGARWQKL